MDTILRYLKQPSTQRFLVMILGLIGWNISPDNIEAIIAGALGLLAAIEGLRDEDKDKPSTKDGGTGPTPPPIDPPGGG